MATSATGIADGIAAVSLLERRRAGDMTPLAEGFFIRLQQFRLLTAVGFMAGKTGSFQIAVPLAEKEIGLLVALEAQVLAFGFQQGGIVGRVDVVAF